MNTTELMDALKIHGSWPTSDDLFSPADFLVLFNMCMKIEINPIMIKLNDEYFLQSKDYTISSGTTYRLPRRIISIRDLKLVDSSGNETDLARNFEEDRASGRTGYYLARNSIELSTDITAPTLRLKYFMRPSKLVLTTACAQVESIDTGLSQVVVTAAPATFANGTLTDFVQNDNPYDWLSIDQAISNVSGTTLTFASLPSDLVVGDWISIANESPVPQVPEELHALLVHAGLVRTLGSKKDKAYKDAKEAFEMLKTDVINMLDPRVNNSSVKMRSGMVHNYFTNTRY